MKLGKLKIKDKLCLPVATLFGVGYVPLLPGTAASLVAVIIFILIKNASYFFTFTIFSIIISFLCCGRAEKIFNEKDCKKIVIDDFSGMLITLLWIPKRVE
ncbi:MAG: phosphatidylglycerophosphatase A, partial [Candidatus Omnitrophota bacterium]